MTTAWHDCVLKLEQDLPAQIFTVWIKPLVFLSWSESDHLLKIGAPNRMKLDWVKSQFAGKIEKIVTELFHPDAKVSFEITPLAYLQQTSFDLSANNDAFDHNNPHLNDPTNALPKKQASQPINESSSQATGIETVISNRATGFQPIIARHIERADRKSVV